MPNRSSFLDTGNSVVFSRPTYETVNRKWIDNLLANRQVVQTLAFQETVWCSFCTSSVQQLVQFESLNEARRSLFDKTKDLSMQSTKDFGMYIIEFLNCYWLPGDADVVLTCKFKFRILNCNQLVVPIRNSRIFERIATSSFICAKCCSSF